MPENGMQTPEELVRLFETGKAAIERLIEENRRLADELAVQTRSATEKAEEAAMLRAKLQSRAAEFERMQRQEALLTEETQKLRSGWKEMQSRTSAAEAAAGENQERASNLELELEIKRNTVTRLHDQLNRMMPERNELTRRMTAFAEQIRGLQAQLESRQEAIRSWEEKFAESERKNDTLANLYLASFQLHSTLDLNEVIITLKEILINFVGAQSFAIALSSEMRRGDLAVVASEGLDSIYPREFSEPLSETFRRAMQGEASFSDNPATASDEPDRPVACIPLATKNEVIGLLAIYGLLVQKDRFTALDHQLFTLLSRVAATAILGAKLYGHSETSGGSLRSFLGRLVGGQRKEAAP